jgi:hypothetical protein
MTQAPASVFKIPTKSPQPARGAASRARKAAPAKPKATGLVAGRVAGIETRAATRGDGEVIEMDLGVTVYPPRQKGGRWGAVWLEDGERQQCESVSEEKLAEKLEKVRQRIAVGAANMTKPGADLIAWYLNPDRLPVGERWSRTTRCHHNCPRRTGRRASTVNHARVRSQNDPADSRSPLLRPAAAWPVVQPAGPPPTRRGLSTAPAMPRCRSRHALHRPRRGIVTTPASSKARRATSRASSSLPSSLLRTLRHCGRSASSSCSIRSKTRLACVFEASSIASYANCAASAAALASPSPSANSMCKTRPRHPTQMSSCTDGRSCVNPRESWRAELRDQGQRSEASIARTDPGMRSYTVITLRHRISGTLAAGLPR